MRIPTTVMGLGGLITVEVVEKLYYKGKLCAGLWLPITRTIKLLKQTKVEMQYSYYHELFHAAAHDSGLRNMLKPNLEEALADMSAMSMMRAKA